VGWVAMCSTKAWWQLAQGCKGASSRVGRDGGRDRVGKSWEPTPGTGSIQQEIGSTGTTNKSTTNPDGPRATARELKQPWTEKRRRWGCLR
jgi:hypothetical protein